MKLKVLLFLLLANVGFGQENSKSVRDCQEKADGELKNKHSFDYYNIDSTCYSTPRGMHYSGKVSVTKSGKTCQAWINQFPNDLFVSVKNECNFPERSRAKAKNYCRNPSNSPKGPWCYTNATGQWEYCDVEACPKFQLEYCQENADNELKYDHIENWLDRDNQCYSTPQGMHYSGTVNVTKNGRTCQPWIDKIRDDSLDSVKNDCNFPERNRAKAKNYCRNPSNSPEGPWCYTDDPVDWWEYCNVKNCSKLISCQEFAIFELENEHIVEWNTRDNICYSTQRGMLYSGNVSVTKSGRTCQPWMLDSLHNGNIDSLNDCNYPERSRVKARNYCRNPRHFPEGPWCFTNDSKVPWEYCDVKKCFMLQGRISDSPNYKNYPMVYNMEQECHPQTDQNLQTCTEKAWHIVYKIQLNNEIAWKNTTELDECYNWCLNTFGCIAVKFDAIFFKCYIYNKNLTQKENEDKTFAHFLKCCSMKDIQESQVNFHHLPIVFASSESCMPQTDNNVNMCEHKAFHVHERSTQECNPNFIVNNPFECMNKCLENPQCKSYRTIEEEYYLISCCLITVSSNGKLVEHYSSFVNEMMCCKVDDESFWESKNTDLLMLYQPDKLCNVFLPNTDNCMVKIWHVEDELRMKSHYRIASPESLQVCLNECSQDVKCIGVSYDWSALRCLFFKKSIQYTNHYGQKRWTSYTLKCCDGFKD